jgi:long-subunit fatty acid transport protein
MALTTTFSVSANEANYQSYIVGDRAPGMGGAVCASAGGVDASFFNPAGLSLTKHNILSISASLYGFQKVTMDNALYSGRDFEGDVFVTIPSSFSTVWDIDEKSAFSFSAFVPQRISMSEMDSTVSTAYSYSYSREDQTLWIGPSYGYQINERLSVGASLFVLYRTYRLSQAYFYGSSGVQNMTDFDYTSMDLLGLIGAQYQLSEQWRLGVLLQTPSLNISGDGDYQYSYVTATGDRGMLNAKNMNAKNDQPIKLTAGVSWSKPKCYGAGLDLTLHGNNDYDRLKGNYNDGSDAALDYKNETVFDINLGGEYYIRNKYPIRAGFFTSFSSAPDTKVDTAQYPGKIDLYGLTLSAGSESEHMTLNVGINYIFGKGDSYGWSPDGLSAIDNAKEQNLYIFASSSYMF